ncbi:hypothetical protein ACVJGD_000672 [Bradyrhizobium sp. USDA 10063]
MLSDKASAPVLHRKRRAYLKAPAREADDSPPCVWLRQLRRLRADTLDRALLIFRSELGTIGPGCALGGLRGSESPGQVNSDLFEQLVSLTRIEIHPESLFHAELREIVVGCCLDAMTRKATLSTFQRAAVDGDDRPPRCRNPYKRGNVASDACDAGHFRFSGSIQSNREMVSQLSGA